MMWMSAPIECAVNLIRARQNKSAIVEDLQENMILSRTQFKITEKVPWRGFLQDGIDQPTLKNF